MLTDLAVILAGGLGTRLHPYTLLLPKPLMPLGEIPILEIIIRQLKKYHFQNIILTVNHQADIIKAYFGCGKKFGINIKYSLEPKRLGTMGPLSLLKDLPENFLVMNGDILTDISFGDLYKTHVENENNFTICSVEREQKIDYGVLTVEASRLVGLAEKPVKKYHVSTGVYIVSKKLAEKMIPFKEYFGFDDLMYKCLNSSIEVEVYKHNGFWLDIGRPVDYEEAIKLFSEKRDLFLDDNGG